MTHPLCPRCQQPTEQDGELNGQPVFTCKTCGAVVRCTKDYIEKLAEKLHGKNPNQTTLESVKG